ncbi:hypothetical protein CDL12_18648 [Handroanthus impetiginosus]|uniref:BHLH domain-containing protein n=1 Tax=Handroanthus impetiginosus TaxID=429701 RepID=A0A2G9GU05_9LAMI|nr:hypothetical protein CDL12_18648 [Handroanthus impetiginosus]
MESEGLSDFFEDSAFSSAAASPDDIFSVLEAWESASGEEKNGSFEFQKSAYSPLSGAFQESETELEAASPRCKRQKMTSASTAAASASQIMEDGQQRMSHITVERNRRKQMNENLSVLRSLMPCFYVKRGDQASIIGGVVDYITELQQVLQSLEAKKQRKAYSEVLSPRVISSPRPSALSPRKPPLSPRLSLPISPSTPQPSSPYRSWMHQSGFLNSPSLPSPVEPSPCNSSTSSINDAVNELVASSKSTVAEVEVKFSGPNLLLKTVSHQIPGQAIKIISALEELALEILQIGIECQLSAEELAQQIQQTFC